MQFTFHAGNEPDALTVHLQDTHITCYRLPGPFEAPHPPGIWIPGTVSGVERSDDTCQRATTLGADYRGTGSTTVGGAACLQWGFQTAGVRTLLLHAGCLRLMAR